MSGLAAAHRLGEIAPHIDFTLFEAKTRLGGVLETVEHGCYLIERSADMFTTREPWAFDLCKRIGIADDLIGTDARYRKAQIVFRGKLHSVPDGFQLMMPSKLWPLATSPLLSIAGKARVLGEYLVPPSRDLADESLSSFVRRRLGDEAFERLVQPLVGGIYTADPEKLSMAATMPQFLEMERSKGGLLRGMLQSPTKTPANDSGSGARYGQFLAPRRGMSQLVAAIERKLPANSIRLSTKVQSVVRRGDGWMLTCDDEQSQFFDAVIYALPVSSHGLLTQIDGELGSLVAQIQLASCAVVVLGFRRDQIRHPLNAFGFVVPAIEKRRVIAGSFASVKFPGRAAEDRVLIRVFIGGALQPELAFLPDDELTFIAREELLELIGASGSPEVSEVVRWQHTMPQYHVGHLNLVDRIEIQAMGIPRFALAGNAYRGVGIPFCVRSGEQAAERIVASLRSHTETLS